MNEFGIRDTDLQMILQVIDRFPVIESAVIFGSRAKGTFKKGSDVDIALFGKGIDFRTTVSVGSILNEEMPMPYFFDIVNYSSICNENFRNHIDHIGKKIH
ncbi:MAG: nucleotidyltransferase domain-containing protein [Bacteroidales bacterium]|jgi:predicted nucleotidyltransferase|nr:nucleotidyltransferase domain-containing protein [Bacteroidales bacterium]